MLILVLSLLVLAASPVFAGGGKGSGTGGGTGSGGGNGEPLMLTSSDPADGQKDVQVEGHIKLVFSKNVTNMTVKENNLKCFSLTQDSTIVPIKVIIADDQVEPEKKNDIEVVPDNELLPGVTYTLKVDGSLKSKSGVDLGKEISISFTTAGGNTGTSEIVSADTTAGGNTGTAEIVSTDTKAGSLPEKNSGNTAATGKSGSNTTIIVVAICALLIIIIAVISITRRKAK